MSIMQDTEDYYKLTATGFMLTDKGKKRAIESVTASLNKAAKKREVKHMTTEVIGIVEEVMNKGVGKGSGLRIAGLKYGVYDPEDSGLDLVAAGTTVSLRFKESEKGGTVYKNVQGKVTTVKDGTAVTPAPVSTATAKSGYRRNGEAGGFPIHAEAYERALDRRNAINVAASLATQYELSEDAVFELAQRIEAYTTGGDVADAIDAMKFVASKED